jgi:AcrR family transcriptional regulator
MVYSVSSRNPAATRTAILDAARSLFEAQDYLTVGLDAVAKQAGVSRQAIYLHFDSKAAMLEALHQRINEQDVAPAFEKVWRAKSAAAALDAWVDACADAIPKILGIFNALEPKRQLDADAEATWKAPAEGQYAGCRRLAELLDRDHALARGVSVTEAADMVWSLTSVRAYESLVIERGWSRQHWTRWLKKTLRRLLSDHD